jgi:hypothetical protein
VGELVIYGFEGVKRVGANGSEEDGGGFGWVNRRRMKRGRCLHRYNDCKGGIFLKLIINSTVCLEERKKK